MSNNGADSCSEGTLVRRTCYAQQPGSLNLGNSSARSRVHPATRRPLRISYEFTGQSNVVNEVVLNEDIDILVAAESQALATRICRLMGRALSGRYHPCSESEGLAQLREDRFSLVVLGNPGKFTSHFLSALAEQRSPPRLILFETDFSLNAPLLDDQAKKLGLDLVSILPLPCPPERLDAVIERLLTGTGNAEVQRAPMSLEEISNALQTDRIRAWFQPKVRLSDGKVTGFEALARWLEPDGTLLPPALFIPAAEDSELIVDLTRKLIEDSLTAVAAWRKTMSNLKVSVNAIGGVLDDKDFLPWLDRQFTRHGLSADALIIEITESRVAGKATDIVEHLTRLRQLGVGVSVDDFGTGYSSLLQLSRMPCTELKIDRGFVSGASVQQERNVLLRNSVNIGHGLGLNVVAEGVETRADWEAVARAAADEAQGWYIGKAQPEDNIEAWMQDWASRASLLTREASQAGHDQITSSTEWSIQGVWGRLSTTQWITTIGLMALSALVARLV